MILDDLLSVVDTVDYCDDDNDGDQKLLAAAAADADIRSNCCDRNG